MAGHRSSKKGLPRAGPLLFLLSAACFLVVSSAQAASSEQGAAGGASWQARGLLQANADNATAGPCNPPCLTTVDYQAQLAESELVSTSRPRAPAVPVQQPQPHARICAVLEPARHAGPLHTALSQLQTSLRCHSMADSGSDPGS